MMSQFSFYTSPVDSYKGHLNNDVLNIEKLYELITGTTYKKIIEQIRKVPDKSNQDKIKKDLNYFTVSGIFAPGTRKAESIISHSGFLQIDIDAKDNPNKTFLDIKNLICEDPYLLMIFLSPTGSGAKAIAKIPADAKRHKESFTTLETHFKAKYGITIDKKCKDVARPFFVSYDADAILKSAIEIELPDAKQKVLTKSVTPYLKDKSNIETDFEKKIRHIKKLCEVVEQTGIDLTADYNFYLKIGFAIASGLGEHGREYYHRICKFYQAYTVEETNKQFEACKKPGAVKWASLFGIASDYGLVIFPPDQKKTTAPQNVIPSNGTGNNHTSDSKAVDTQTLPEDLKFWEVRNKTLDDGTKQFKDVVIADLNLLNLLKGFGYRRYDVPGGFSFVQVKHNIVCEVQPQHIQDSFSAYLKKLPEKIEPHVTRYDLESKIVKQSETLFGKNRLSWLTSDEPINFNQDTKTESFVYYSNGFVKCTPGQFSFHPYNSLKKAIWKTQLKERDFVKLPEDKRPLQEYLGYYAKFIWNVAGKDLDRFLSLMTLIGYLLHDFKETKLKAVVLTDSKLSEGNNGRTGKTLFGKAIEQIRDVCELNGKEFKADKAFKYQEAKLSTQIVFLNDAMKRFVLETLYNDITEGITIEKKNQSPVKLKVKYLITTNATIKTEGASSKDRIIEYEFADHYSDKYHPRNEFGHWFFTEWDKNEWNRFDNFMMHCLCLFLKEGIIQPDPVNLQNRKLIDQTCKQFFDFIEAGNIKPDVKFCLQDACENFQNSYPEYDFYTKQPNRKFSKWLKSLPELHKTFEGLSFQYITKNDGNLYYILK